MPGRNCVKKLKHSDELPIGQIAAGPHFTAPTIIYLYLMLYKSNDRNATIFKSYTVGRKIMLPFIS